MKKAPQPRTPAEERLTLIRDIGVLQVKLLVDGLRDLLLVPASLAAGVISLLSARHGRPGPQFYHLLGVGKQTERYINLFGAIENSPEKFEQPAPFGDADIDDLVGRVETFVIQEYRSGEVTAQAKERLDKALSTIRRRGRTEGHRDSAAGDPGPGDPTSTG